MKMSCPSTERHIRQDQTGLVVVSYFEMCLVVNIAVWVRQLVSESVHHSAMQEATLDCCCISEWDCIVHAELLFVYERREE